MQILLRVYRRLGIVFQQVIRKPIPPLIDRLIQQERRSQLRCILNIIRRILIIQQPFGIGTGMVEDNIHEEVNPSIIVLLNEGLQLTVPLLTFHWE